MYKLPDSESSPLFSFGLITDVQYADSPDKMNFTKTKWRRYRHALKIVEEAVLSWLDHTSAIRFILHVGDVIDGINKSKNQTEEAVQKVLKAFSELPVRIFHTVGNHELYNFCREELVEGPLFPRELTYDLSSSYLASAICDEKVNRERCYYSFSPHKNFLVVVLDCYEISLLGYSPEHPNYKLAKEILQNKNKNEDWNSPLGLEGDETRFVEYNGGVSQTQLDWFNALLKTAEGNQQKVIVVGHISIYHGSIQDKSCLVWNYEEILFIIYRYSCVVAYIAGHDHAGGYGVDEHGIHHLTLEGVIEAPMDSTAFGTCDVYDNFIHLIGNGVVETRFLKFKNGLNSS